MWCAPWSRRSAATASPGTCAATTAVSLSPACFNGRFRDECLNRELLESALEAQVVARAFRDEYNDIRPHSSLDYRSPSEVRAELLKRAAGSGQARQAGPSLRPQLASTDSNP